MSKRNKTIEVLKDRTRIKDNNEEKNRCSEKISNVCPSSLDTKSLKLTKRSHDLKKMLVDEEIATIFYQNFLDEKPEDSNDIATSSRQKKIDLIYGNQDTDTYTTKAFLEVKLDLKKKKCSNEPIFCIQNSVEKKHTKLFSSKHAYHRTRAKIKDLPYASYDAINLEKNSQYQQLQMQRKKKDAKNSLTQHHSKKSQKQCFQEILLNEQRKRKSLLEIEKNYYSDPSRKGEITKAGMEPSFDIMNDMTLVPNSHPSSNTYLSTFASSTIFSGKRKDKITKPNQPQVSTKWYQPSVLKFVFLGFLAQEKNFIRCLERNQSPRRCFSNSINGIQTGFHYYPLANTKPLKKKKCQFWDGRMTNNDDTLMKILSRGYCKFPHVIFIVYDTSSEKSFQALPLWINMVNQYADPKALKILLANQISSSNQILISQKEGIQFADKYQLPFIEMDLDNNGQDVLSTLEKTIKKVYNKTHF